MEELMTIKEERNYRKPSFAERSKDWFSGKGYVKKAFANKIDAARKTAAVLLMTAVVGQFSFGMLGIGAAPGDPATMDGSLAVLNTTQNTDYSETYVNALVDDVVMFQLAMHNQENPDSGTDAYNVMAHITLPTNTGTNLVAGGSFTGSNTNSVSDIAAVHTQVPANLEYIPGSAEWTYNAGTNENPNWVTQAISDNLVTSGVNLGTMQPCWNMQQTVRVLARVTGSGLSVNKQVAHPGETWSNEITAEPGDVVNYAISYENEGNTTLTNLGVGDNLPGYMEYVPGSTTLINANHPNGLTMPDGVTTGGLDLEDYTPGSGGHIMLQARIVDNVPSGCHQLRNVGVVQADQTAEVWDTAFVNVCGITEQAPEFAIAKDAFNVTQGVDATTTIAQENDVVRYNLNTTNIGDEAGDYLIQDDLSDVLEYATIIDTMSGTMVGNTISYGTATIGVGETAVRTFEVQIRPSTDWPVGGDLTLTNVYGNEVEYPVEPWMPFTGDPEIALAKSAFNETQNVNAVTTVARAGDVITYTLTTANVGDAEATDVLVIDDVSDILEYATITEANGGIYDNGNLFWSLVSIDAGDQVTHNFTITVLDPLPDNPTVGTSYDYRMDNVYGNDVQITLERPVILGGVIAGASTLASAGANTILIFGLALFMFSSSLYLYVREEFLLAQAMALM